MRVEVFESISDIGAEEWNAIVGRNRLICRHEYLKAVEMSGINDCQYFYPVVYDGDRMVAHTCVYFISTELDLFAGGIVKRSIDYCRRAWSNLMVLRSVECGTPVALGNTISFREGVDRSDLFLRMVKRVEGIAKDLNVHILLFRDFYEGEIEFFDCLSGLGYRRIHNLPSTRIHVRWNSFDAYVNSMRSQYRCKLLAQMKKFEESGASLSLVNNFSSHAKDLARLWRNVHENSIEYSREVLLEGFFSSIDACLPEETSVILATMNDRLIGYLLLFIDDDVLIPISCGMDYTVSKDVGVYFNMFYEAVRFAIDMKMKEIDFGITTIEPKVDLGAVVKPLYMYMKHRNRFMNIFVPRLFDAMTPQASLKSRRVFKK